VANPYGSLAQAQTAMENSSTTKTAIVSGTCNLSANWTLTSADSGETWEAACGQVTTINGGMTTVTEPNVTTECTGIGASSDGYYVYVNGANNVAFYGFTFENLATEGADTWGSGGLIFNNSAGNTVRWNTFNNTAMAAITLIEPTSSTTIDSNTINGVSDGYPTNYNMSNTSGTDGLCFSPAAINMMDIASIPTGTGNNNSITHNLIENTQGGGINLNGNDTTVDSNVITNTGSECFDCGQIYSCDTTGNSYTGNVITNNSIQNFANSTYGNVSLASGLYFDCGGPSNLTVTGNAVCATSAVGGDGNSGPDIIMANGGGSNIVVENNVFGVLYGPNVAYYSGTTGNLLENNIFYSSDAFAGTVVQNGGGSCPTDTNNLYWSATGATIPNTQCVDSSPTYANPGFTNYSSCNFAMSNPPSGFTQLTTDRGPLANTVCPGGY
jgi:hypothetical protein